jgi:hypothetical protein
MSSGGKGGSGGGSQAHDYFGTIAGAVCIGIVDALVAVIIDGKEVWPGAKPWASGVKYSVNDLKSWGGRTWKCILTHTSGPGNAPPSAVYWTQYTLPRAGDSTNFVVESYGQATIYWGTESQTADPVLRASGNDFGEDHPDYKGICYVVLKDFLFGRERTSAPNLEVIVQRKPQQSIVTGVNADLADGQANMMAVAAELLTHWNGLGMDAAAIDATTFQAVAVYLGNNAALSACAPLFDSQQTVREFIDQLEQLTDTFIRFNPVTLLIEAGYYPHGTLPGSSTNLTIDDLTERPHFTPQGWASAKSLAVVQFNDRTRAFKQTSIRVPDARAFRVLGEIRPLTLNRPFITRAAQATQHGAETMRTQGQPQLGGSITVRREKARNITPGQYVLVDIDLEPGGATLLQYFRVKSRDVPRQGPIKLTLEADVTLAAISTGPADTSSAELNIQVPAFANYRILESPVLLSDGQVDEVLVLAERAAVNIAGFQIYCDSDTSGTFQVIGNTRGFACRGTLRGDFSATETGPMLISVPSQVDTDLLTDTVNAQKADDDTLLAILVKADIGTQIPPFVRFRFPQSLTPLSTIGYPISEDAGGYAEIEVCSISAISLNSAGNYDLTVLRARRATKQRAFIPQSTEVWIVRRGSLETNGHLQFRETRDNRLSGALPATEYFRLAPYTHLDTRDLADCDSIPFQFPKSSSAGPLLELTAPTSNSVQYPPNWQVGLVVAIGDFYWFNGAAYQANANHTTSQANKPPNGAFWNSGIPVPYPYIFDVEGTWTDPNEDMVATQIIIEKDNGYSSIVDDDQFTPIGSADISESIKLPENGNWSIRLKAVDATGLQSERVIRVTALGTALKCATPKFYHNGKKVSGTQWNLYGRMKLKCATPDVVMQFRYNRFEAAFLTTHTSAWFTYDPNDDSYDKRPNGLQVTGSAGSYGYIEAKATRVGYTDSDIEILTAKDKDYAST